MLAQFALGQQVWVCEVGIGTHRYRLSFYGAEDLYSNILRRLFPTMLQALSHSHGFLTFYYTTVCANNKIKRIRQIV